MTIAFMRLVDYYMGVPLCWCFAFLRTVQGWLRLRRFVSQTTRTILVIKCLGMGSVILTLPTLQALRDRYPRARIFFLSFASNREVLELLNPADEVLTIDTASVASFITTTFRAVRRLRKESLDLVVDLEFFAKFPLIICFLAGAKHIAGFDLLLEWWRKALLDFPGFFNYYHHVKDIFLSLAYLVATNDHYYRDFDDYRRRYGLPRITVPQRYNERLAEQLDRLDVPAAARQHLIVVNPNAGKELSPHLKRWPVELFADLSQQLLVQYPESVLIYTGVSDERVYVRSIIDRVRSEYSPVCHRMFDAAGHLSLGELVALFAQSFVFITIDSGPMHLASLVHAPSVCLFGAESFRLYGPLNPRAVVVAKDLYCIPMFTVYDGKKNRLSQNIPMQLITVDEVFEAVATLRTGGEFVESDAHHHSVVREMDAVIARAV